MTTKTPVYLKCAPQSDGSAIIDSTTPYVQALPSSADGKIYIFLGVAYSATNIELYAEHPVYYHDGNGIKLWTGKAIPTKTSDLVNDSGFITSAPVTSVNGQTGAVTLSIPSTAADVGAIPAPSSPATGAFLVWSGSAWVAQSGVGLTPAIKAALLQLAEKVAYIDDQGQDYYQDLYDALYPLSELVSISAVFTQGQTIVYDTDSLDSLKSMLVVTATYEDSSTHTVPSSNYTLSGTLTVGTSTITVSYGGKTDTFTVTVTAGTLYPLYNGSHSFNYDRSVVVTGGNHFEFSDVGSYTSAFANYINITDVRNNGSAPDSTNNINSQPAAFTIPAGATVTLELKNISATRASGTSTWSFGVRGTGTTTISGLAITGLGPNPNDKSVTVTIANSTDVGCVFFYARDYSQIAGDVSMTVNGVRYI